jgi:hypothetical protein
MSTAFEIGRMARAADSRAFSHSAKGDRASRKSRPM